MRAKKADKGKPGFRPVRAAIFAVAFGLTPGAGAQSPTPPGPALDTVTPLQAAECLLTIAGETWIDGPCQYDPDADGSFSLYGERHFIFVRRTGPTTGDAAWNGAFAAGQAEKSLGTLRHDGACWVNRSVRACAWAHGQRPR